ncbi:MAG: IS110 family transposase [Deltaproteobacteria bacterium]|nr:IS110 family transposase [Deltaproteobacteria bacterium]
MKPNSTERTLPKPIGPVLYLAFELSQKEWKLGFTIGFAQSARLRNIPARNTKSLQKEIQMAKKRFNLPETTIVVSCYEAGRDGFWLHRCITSLGIINLVVDSSSIEVNRRARRNKTDNLDVRKLLNMLIRYHNGEYKVWSVVKVPSLAIEDYRQLHRELNSLKKERTQHINRIKGLLASQGKNLSVTSSFEDKLAKLRLWDGRQLTPYMRSRLEREYKRIQLIEEQVKQIDDLRFTLLRTSQDPAIEQVRHLIKLKGIGINSAWLFVMEFFAWREFRNRREVGALAGLTPTHNQSGDSSHGQGISKAGNRFVRDIVIEIAWGWLRYQPNAKTCLWYQQRFGSQTKRVRRIGIVALARRLLIDLWRYLETGEIPEGAVFLTSS